MPCHFSRQPREANENSDSFLQLLEGKSGAIVIAGVRSLSTCQALQQLKLRFPGQLQIFVIDVSNNKTIAVRYVTCRSFLPNKCWIQLVEEKLGRP